MKYIEFLEQFPKLRRLFGAQVYVFGKYLKQCVCTCLCVCM